MKVVRPGIMLPKEISLLIRGGKKIKEGNIVIGGDHIKPPRETLKWKP